jgi:predicted nuclease of predicted toxin-antitoxin system
VKSSPFLADENIAAPLIAALRESDWDVVAVAEHSPGISDSAVLRQACTESRIILAEDKDFGELTFRMRWNNAGVVLLRLGAGPWQAQWTRLHLVLETYACRLQKTFTIVEPKRVRFRPMPRSP